MDSLSDNSAPKYSYFSIIGQLFTTFCKFTTFFGIYIIKKQVDFARKGSFLEMLVVFRGIPIAAPMKAIGSEDFRTKVVLINLVWEVLVPIHVGTRC